MLKSSGCGGQSIPRLQLHSPTLFSSNEDNHYLSCQSPWQHLHNIELITIECPGSLKYAIMRPTLVFEWSCLFPPQFSPLICQTEDHDALHARQFGLRPCFKSRLTLIINVLLASELAHFRDPTSSITVSNLKGECVDIV